MSSNAAQEALQKAKVWLTGGTKLTDEDVLAAREKVERAGGRILPHKGRSGLIRRNACDLEHWGTVCEQIQRDLHLSVEEVAGLKSAALSDECEVFVVEDSPAGSEHSTCVVAYRTVRDAANKTMHIVYGRYEASMQVLNEPMSTGGRLCVKLGSRTFMALPYASPACADVGREMKDKPFTLPRGVVPVAADDKDFASILRDVVTPYPWGTYVLVVKGDEQQPWKAFWTAAQGDSEAGKPFGNMDWFKALDEGQYVFTGTSGRLLVEAMPATHSAELISAWKRYATISAQAEWGSHFGLQAD